MEINIKPLQDRVVVKPNKVEETTKGGIIIIEQAREKPMEGVVVAVGPGKHTPAGELIPVPLASGQKILYGKYAGMEVNIGEETFLIMHIDDILGVFTD